MDVRLCAPVEHSLHKRLGPAVNCISHTALIAATLTSSFRHWPPLQLQKMFPLPVTIRKQSCNFSRTPRGGARRSVPTVRVDIRGEACGIELVRVCRFSVPRLVVSCPSCEASRSSPPRCPEGLRAHSMCLSPGVVSGGTPSRL